MERVDRIELGHVDQVDPHQLADPEPDRVAHVVEGDGVDGVHLVLAVEVGVEPVHGHHQLVGRRPGLGRVDDEDAVEALVDVAAQRRDVAGKACQMSSPALPV